MKGYVTNIDRDTTANDDFRRVLFTGPNTQLVLMTLKPGDEIGLETHENHDQFLRVESGRGVVELDGTEQALEDGSAVIVPAGVRHNVINRGQMPLRLYTLYSPPEHAQGTVHHTKREAERDGKHLEHGARALIEAGRKAPSFTLKDGNGRDASLQHYRGRAVILAFYPGDWSPVCGDQLALYNELVPDFQDMGADLIGISVDSTWSHAAFAENRHLHFPLLSDFEPKGAVARQYGAYRESDGTCERALFVLDRDGIVTWSYLSPVDINPGADGIVGALSKLKSTEPATTTRTVAPRDDEAHP